jgi:hypothetical protein
MRDELTRHGTDGIPVRSQERKCSAMEALYLVLELRSTRTLPPARRYHTNELDGDNGVGDGPEEEGTKPRCTVFGMHGSKPSTQHECHRSIASQSTDDHLPPELVGGAGIERIKRPISS